MCFFNKKKKARKLAEKQAREAIENKVIVEEKIEPIKEVPVVEKKPKAEVKAEVKAEEKAEPKAQKKVDIKPQPIVENVQEEKKELKSAKYHVSQNKDPRSDSYRKWRVRKEGSNKTIKFFDTQKQAIEYAESLAETSGSSVVIHKIDGSIRKQDYTKKA